MPQRNEVVSLPQRPGAAHSIGDIEKLAEAVARSRMFGIQTREQALVLMAIAQAEGRHPAEAARDYSIIQGRPAKTSEAMMRDFLSAGGRVEWHTLSDDAADATFSHPAGGKIRIIWDMPRAAKAGLSSKDMWKKYPRQMLRSRCVSEGVRTVCPSATSGFYVPEEAGDIPAMALPEAPSDTTAELDQFAAVTGDAEPPPYVDFFAEAHAVAQRGTDAFRTFWGDLSPDQRDVLRVHLAEYRRIAKQADDPFGLPPLDTAEQQRADPQMQPAAGPAPDVSPSSDAGQPFAPGDVFGELDHEARAATKEGTTAFNAWWKTLRRADADLLRALRPEYERLAAEADAQSGMAL
jgi:hypothetical protein